jgi:hypothetical protein
MVYYSEVWSIYPHLLHSRFTYDCSQREVLVKRVGTVVLLMTIIAVAGLWVSGLWQVSASALPMPDSLVPTSIAPPLSTPVTLPTPAGFIVPPTPVDFRGNQLHAPPAFLPTVTPLPINRITDFNPALPNRCKSEVIVKRSNGAYETFLVPLGQDRSRVKATLGPGDQIFLDGPPPVLMGPPPKPTITADGKIVFGPPASAECQ